MFTTTELRVLAAIFPEGKDVTTPEIEQRSGYSHERVYSTLKKLVSSDIITSRKIGNTLLHTINRFDDRMYLAFAYHTIGRKLQFLEANPPIQVWFLLETWWHHINWLIAYPFEGIGDRLPYDFNLDALHHLLALPVAKPVQFDDFANRLIQATGLKWKAPDMTPTRNSLHRAVEQMVISILEDFGIVKREEKEDEFDGYSLRRLHAFTITDLGRGLLQVIAGGPV